MATRKVINGFSKGYNKSQKATWVLFFGDFLILFLIVLPLSSFAFKLISVIGCTITGMIVFISTYICSKCDPTDSVLVR